MTRVMMWDQRNPDQGSHPHSLPSPQPTLSCEPGLARSHCHLWLLSVQTLPQATDNKQVHSSANPALLPHFLDDSSTSQPTQCLLPSKHLLSVLAQGLLTTMIPAAPSGLASTPPLLSRLLLFLFLLPPSAHPCPVLAGSF